MDNKTVETNDEIKGAKFCLLDTDVLLKLLKPNIEKKRRSEGLNRFIFDFFQQDYKAMITDMSFVELVSGCNNLDEFKKTIKDIFDCEIIITGFSEELKNYIQSKIQDSTIDLIDFSDFKKTVLELREKEMFSYFNAILTRYIGVFFACLDYSDDKHVKGLFQEFLDFARDDSEKFNSIINHSYIGAYRKEFEYSNLLQDVVACLIATMKAIKDPTSNFDLVFNTFSQIDSQQLMKKYIADKKIELIDFFDEKKDKLFSLFTHFRTFKDRDNLYGTVIFDAFTYSMLCSGFCGGRFFINDLIDIYNLSFITNNENHFVFYTDDKKWKKFMLMESLVNNDFSKRVIGDSHLD